MLENIQTKLDALTDKDTLQMARNICPYPLELELVPFFENYWAPTIDMYHGEKALPICIYTILIH